MTKPLKVFLGFDFYGAGNIGDDMMIAGFLDGFAIDGKYEFTCCLAQARLASQRRRFPAIRWLSVSPKERVKILRASDLWLGLGGTPFQASGGKWLLKQIIADYEVCPEIPKWMVGVGCEAEVLKEQEMAARIVQETQRIWTRDAASRSVLVNELGAADGRVSTGGDLAHVYLQRIMPDDADVARAETGVGLILFSEQSDQLPLYEIRSFVSGLNGSETVTFLGNDVRPKQMEHRLYRALYGGLFSRLRRKPGWLVPDYMATQTSALVAHFPKFHTVISSRYHGLLAAAWAGCGVAGIARSSKLEFLAEELGIPILRGDVDKTSLRVCLDSASTVPRSVLHGHAAAARVSLDQLSAALETLRSQEKR